MRPPAASPLSRAVRAFLDSEASGGLALMGAAALALMVANSPLGSAYAAIAPARLGPLTAAEWVNDGLMALFFLLVGLEIKRELISGELSTWPARRLPGVAALAGMAVPAAIYALVNRTDPAALRGWAIPSATDIAFALGVLALVGGRAASSLRLFLTAVAVLDDMGAVVIIALFYTAKLHLGALAVAGGGVVLLALLNRLGVRRLWPYLIPAPAIWWAMHLSGVHATIAGVAIAATIPGKGERSPLERLEHALEPWVAYLIVPLFGFLNAGVDLSGVTPAMAGSGVTLGIGAGLVLGKQAGIMSAVWAADRGGFAARPAGASWREIYGVALLCGIGFTMSLFVGELAFRGAEAPMDEVKMGVLGGSVVSALAAALMLRIGRDRARPQDEQT